MFEHCWEIKRFVLEVGVEAVNTICVLHLGEGASWPVFLLGLHHDIWAWWLTYSSRSLPVVQRLGVGVGGTVGLVRCQVDQPVNQAEDCIRI